MGDSAPPLDERFRMLIESVRDYAMLLLDADGTIVSWNIGAERIKGYKAAEIIGQPVSRFYPEEAVMAGRPPTLLRQAEREGQVEDEGWRVRKDGTRFWSNEVITALRDERGVLFGYGLIARDMTRRRQIEERVRQSEERFRLLIEGVEDYAIFMLDPNGNVATWNSGAERIIGYRAANIIGRNFSIFYTPDDSASGAPLRCLETATREGRCQEEGFRTRGDGTRFWGSSVVSALRDNEGHLFGFAKVTRDLTELKKLEEERIRRAQAEEAIRLRDEFLSIASHELKTPLTSVQLQLQSVHEKLIEKDAEMARKIERAVRNSRRLADLIESLLEVSRMAVGRFELHRQRVDFGDVASDVVERMRDTAAKLGCELSLDIEPGPAVEGSWDKLRVEQAMTNLLSNAVKYGAGAPIEVYLRRADGCAVCEVRDHGPGIPERDLERIFERFEQAASSRHYGGMGLGLYLTRQIMRAHDGSVFASNPPGGGACFTLRLPLVRVDEDRRASNAGSVT